MKLKKKQPQQFMAMETQGQKTKNIQNYWLKVEKLVPFIYIHNIYLILQS
jgi:hypothetical protein